MGSDLRDELHRSAEQGVWYAPKDSPSLSFEWIRALAIDGVIPGTGIPVHAKGIRIRGVTLQGPLDLEHSQLSIPLLLDDIETTDAIVLEQASGRWIGITNSRLAGVLGNQLALAHSLHLQGNESSARIDISGAKVSGDVRLDQQAEVFGGVRLDGAEVGGNLTCSGSSFSNDSTAALTLDNARILGNAFLGDHFVAHGEVRAVGVDIGGQLVCSGATFENQGADALSLDRAHVAGDVAMDDGFVANGKVRLIGATIDGQLRCSGGRFTNPSGVALSLDRASIGGSVLLDRGFDATGPIRMVGATVGGNQVCSNGRFSDENGRALVADGAVIKGDVFLNKDFSSEGCIRLPGASIGGQLSCVSGHFVNPDAVGLMLQEATVAGAFLWYPAELAPNTGVNLNACTVGSLVDNIEMWPRDGWLEIDGFTYQQFAGDAALGVDERIAWLRRMGRYHSQPYEQLAAVYETAGRPAAARAVGIAGEEARNATLKRWQRPWHWLWGALTAYGYKPARALRIFAVVLAFAWLFFWWAGASGVMEPTDPAREASAESCTTAYPCYHPLIYAADVMIPVVNLDQRDAWRPDAARPGQVTGSWLLAIDGAVVSWVSVLLTLAGWALTAAFVAALGRTISRA